MGIDARVLIRYQGDKPTEDQITRWGWELCRAIGAKHFFISDGLPTAEYNAQSAAWYEAFKAHPRHVAYQDAKHRDIQQSYRDEIVADIGEFTFQEQRRAIRLSPDYADEYGEDAEEGEPVVGAGKAYYQDAETLFAAEGEWFLQVSLWTRYYGVGYERGDLMTICAVAEWVEANIPGAVVWYGGDSGGVAAELFDAKAREELKKHFYGADGRKYFSGWAKSGTFLTPNPCGLCIPGEPRFNQHGFGGNFIAVNCEGCGKSFASRDGGTTWTEEKKA